MELVFGHTDGRTDGWTDKCGSRNSYLDDKIHQYLSPFQEIRKVAKKIGIPNIYANRPEKMGGGGFEWIAFSNVVILVQKTECKGELKTAIR